MSTVTENFTRIRVVLDSATIASYGEPEKPGDVEFAKKIQASNPGAEIIRDHYQREYTPGRRLSKTRLVNTEILN